MSLTALEQAVRDELRSGMKLAESICDTRLPPGEPPVWSGSEYFAVWGSDWSAGEYTAESDDTFDEVFAVTITITKRIGDIPLDVLPGEVLHRTKLGLESTARKVIQTTIRGRFSICSRAQAILLDRQSTATIQGFVEPIRFLGVDPPSLVGPDWFGAEEGGDAGLIMNVRLGNARRIQKLEILE